MKRTCPEDVAAAVAPGGELGVVAGPAVDAVGLGAELLVHQGGAALGAHEACLVPVLLLVGQILQPKGGQSLRDHSMCLPFMTSKW